MNKEDIEVEFRGIDRFNRPVFKDNKGNYYGSTHRLYSYLDTKATVEKDFDSLELCFFGRRFNCEPQGTLCNNSFVLKNR